MSLLQEIENYKLEDLGFTTENPDSNLIEFESIQNEKRILLDKLLKLDPETMYYFTNMTPLEDIKTEYDRLTTHQQEQKDKNKKNEKTRLLKNLLNLDSTKSSNFTENTSLEDIKTEHDRLTQEQERNKLKKKN